VQKPGPSSLPYVTSTKCQEKLFERSAAVWRTLAFLSGPPENGRVVRLYHKTVECTDREGEREHHHS
jgi:hypothetical protein